LVQWIKKENNNCAKQARQRKEVKDMEQKDGDVDRIKGYSFLGKQGKDNAGIVTEEK
jgi:hypothetical protein